MRCLLSVLTLVLLLAGLRSPAHAAADPASSCAALHGGGFGDLVDAPTQILNAHWVAASASVPAHCDITGYVATHVGFGMLLPSPAQWNGKLVSHGCGGMCGIVATDFACDGALRASYACVQTDMGHTSSLTDAKWADHDLQALVDFGYRATHVATVAAKAVTAAFYARAPRHNYFFGCSTGGRQGMVSAERFPADFDGIVAIAPAINETGAGMQLLWSVRANLDLQGRPILPAAKLAVLHDAVLAACDMNDGIKDGLIGDPRGCHFDPATLLCKAADGKGCLTRAQLDVVRKIYDGPADSQGRPLFTGGMQLGSELTWGSAFIGTPGHPPSYRAFMDEFWRYVGFMSAPGPTYDAITQFDFDRDPQRLGGMETLFSGSDPDLRGFARRGGKLLLAQGWNDNSVVPLNLLDYYDGVTRFMGGRDATLGFARLFTVPGMEHCQGGDGPWGINYLTVLDGWVEHGQAPDQLLGQHPKPGVVVDWGGTSFPLAADKVAFARPLFLYPRSAFYRGTGNPDDPANYDAR
jgi:hypothetical protein